MAEICPKCGLPKELCVCDVLDRETTKKIRVYKEKKKFQKYATIVEGLQGDELERTAKALKTRLACGGTYKKGVIELQGDHKDAVKKELLALGYPESSIDA
ncbi:MAG: stress response translation initiation inhibitor YciH [Candidatus Micrarchaeota archaeon]|nr:stress response translation initiation inhibitor YciH [Candidatus Micrarchaeota archaeon]MDE1805043.1 stress response translation initiation inhibitor YciH [Candidatus Micrarchaeota archaeon]MDE1846592.1 stress response translation initiation inhibitor YciH [Candidatus Micrarchaeota archaeon]